MTTTTHTPTPRWTTGKRCENVIYRDGDIAGKMNFSDDASDIVIAMNAHDVLVAALRTIRDTTQTIGVASRIARTALRDAGIAESGVAE